MPPPTKAPDGGKWIIPTVLGLLFGGGGLAGVLSNWEKIWPWIKDHPFVATLLGVSCLVGLAILRPAKKIYEALEPRILPPLVDWVWERGYYIHASLGCRGRYYQELIFRHRQFNTRGLRVRGEFKVELDKVFIELRIAPQILNKASTDPLRDNVLPNNRSIWEFLATDDPAYRCLAIIGPPGSGKTTLLDHLALTLAQSRQRRHHRRCRGFIPILLFLRDHKQSLWASEQPTLAKLITQHETAEGKMPPKGWFEAQLKAGRCLVLLDGLDEVASDKQRKKVSEWVDKQVRDYPRNRFLVTSRKYGYETNPLEEASQVEVQPFTFDQVKGFIDSWYLENEIHSTGKYDPGVRRDAAKCAGDLIRRLITAPTLTKLAVNPLLLTMIALVHRYRGALPGRRIELYAEICDVLLGHWQTAKGILDPLSAAQKREVLQPLALHLMQQERREIPVAEALEVIREPLANVAAGKYDDPAEFLKHVERRSGLLLEREPGVYGFAHLTFQEYLAAAQILSERREQILLDRLLAPWWRETIRLYVAQADATPILRACLTISNRADQSDHIRPVQALTLACECQMEKLKADADVLKLVEQTILEGLEAEYPERQHLAATVMLELRLNGLIRLDEHREIDSAYLSCAEYQLFLDEMRNMNQLLQPDHWKSNRFPSGSGLQPLAGMRHSDAKSFCKWLNERIRAAGTINVRFRLPSTVEAAESPMTPIQANPLFEALYGGQVGTWCAGEQPAIVGLDKRVNVEWQGALRSAVNKELIGLDSERLVVRSIEFVRIIAASLVDELVQASHIYALDLDLDRARDIVLNLDHAYALGRARALDRALDLDLAHAHARYLVLDLNRAVGGLLDHDHDLYADRLLFRSDAYARDRLDLDHEIARDLVLALDLTRTLARTRHRNLDLALHHFRDRALALNLDLARTSDLDRLESIPGFDGDHRFDFVFEILTYYALVQIVGTRAPVANASWRHWLKGLFKLSHSSAEGIREDQLLRMHQALLLINERRAGRLPAWEGIRLVRERIEPTTTEYVEERIDSSKRAPSYLFRN